MNPTPTTSAADVAPPAPVTTPVATSPAATPPAAEVVAPQPVDSTPAKVKAAPSALEVAEATPVETPAPATTEFEVPKGFEAQAEVLKAAVTELGLTGDKAKKLAETVATVDAARQKALDETFAAQDAKWASELQSDPEIGGAKFKAAVTDVTRALKRFGGTPAPGQSMTPLTALLHNTGLGNNPLIIKAFAAIGRALADDTISGTTKAAPPGKVRLSDAEIFYGTPTSKE